MLITRPGPPPELGIRHNYGAETWPWPWGTMGASVSLISNNHDPCGWCPAPVMIIYTHEPRLTSAMLWYAAHSSGLWAGKISCNWKQNDKDLLLLPVFSLLVISQYQAAVRKRFVFTLLFTDRHCCRYTFIYFTTLFLLLNVFLSFQALQCLSKLLDELARVEMVAVTNTRHILINTEGKVHRNTFLAVKEPRPASSRQRAVSENKVRGREQQSISDIETKQGSTASLYIIRLAAHTKGLSSSEVNNSPDCSAGLSAALQYCCVVSRSPRGPRPASDQE